MKKAVYHISGFDCANCALKTERYLNKKESIRSASIDFANEKLFVEYRDKELDKEELLGYIKEIENDPIRLEKSGERLRMRHAVFTRHFFITLTRIILSLVLLFVARFAFQPYEKPLNPWAIVLFVAALLIAASDIAVRLVKNIIHRQNPVDENFLMLAASIGAFFLYLFPGEDVEPEFFDGVMVLVLFQIGMLFEGIATNKSKDAISNAIDLRADTANLVVNGKIASVKPETLKVGDVIVVRVGEIVPADGTVIEGSGSFDMSSLTGETVPVGIEKGSSALSGSILRSGSVTMRVSKVFADSAISRILALVEKSGANKSPAEKFITRFARVYTPCVLAIAVLFVIVYGLVGQFAYLAPDAWLTAVERGLEVLVVACPCAIVISVPLAYFAGLGLASRHGVVIKGSNYLDRLRDIGVLFVDKTGTLTYGSFEVLKLVPHGMSEEEFKTFLLAAESRSNHPIAKAVTLHQNTAGLALLQKNYEEIAGLGTKTEYDGHVILAGNRRLLVSRGVDAPEIEEPGTAVYVAVDGKYVGYALLGDVVRDKAKQLIALLDGLNIRTVLLSGDQPASVRSVAEEVGIREYHARMLPEEKTAFLENEIKNNKTKKYVAFAGDGINDTPSIIRADVGFAMGGIGSDIAVENSDVVIMQDHPLKIYDAIMIAKKTRAVAVFNIVFVLLVKVLVMALLFSGAIDQGALSGMVIAILADSGLALLLVLNSLLLLFRKVSYRPAGRKKKRAAEHV